MPDHTTPGCQVGENATSTTPSAIYAISPVASQIAIGWCVRNKPEPVTSYDLTKLARQPCLPLSEDCDPEDGGENED